MGANESANQTYDGRCTCGAVRYRLTSAPMYVQSCHCSWCRRESGTAFALNAIIESDRVVVLQGEPERVDTPSNSGKGQVYLRCPVCKIALWSNYGGAGDKLRFVRVGTLEQPERLPPDLHIFTAYKLPWVALPPDAKAVPEYYDRNLYWTKDSLERRAAALGSPPKS